MKTKAKKHWQLYSIEQTKAIQLSKRNQELTAELDLVKSRLIESNKKMLQCQNQEIQQAATFEATLDDIRARLNLSRKVTEEYQNKLYKQEEIVRTLELDKQKVEKRISEAATLRQNEMMVHFKYCDEALKF